MTAYTILRVLFWVAISYSLIYTILWAAMGLYGWWYVNNGGL